MKRKILLLSLIISIFTISNVFAGHWYSDNKGKWFGYNNNSEFTGQTGITTGDYHGIYYDNSTPQTTEHYIISGWANIGYADAAKSFYFQNGYLHPNCPIVGLDESETLTFANTYLQSGNGGSGGNGGASNGNTADLMPTLALNNEEVFKDTIGANGQQFPLYGLFMNEGVTNTRGNMEFMTNEPLISNFTTLLNTLEYDSQNYTKWIEKLKELYDIGSAYFGAKDRTILDANVLQAKADKDLKLENKLLHDLLNVIVKIIGAALVIYGFLIILFGTLDERGSIGNSLLLEKATRGALSYDKHGQETTFKLRYIALGLAIALLGALIFSGQILNVAGWIIARLLDFVHFITTRR